MSFPRYEHYKDSGVEWLGEVPAGWEIVRLKNIASVNMGQSPKSEDCNQDGDGIPFLQGNADFGDHNPTPRYFCTTANKFAQNGDVLLSVRAPVGAINIANQIYGIGRGLCAITANTETSRGYLYYALGKITEELFSVATGSTYEAVSAEQVGNARCFSPPAKEQHAIAAFLDRETAKIDALIAEQQRLIALLSEKRQAVISHAVTKGLNPDAPMKDSGIEWLGEVPAGWEVLTLGRVTLDRCDGPFGSGLKSTHYTDMGVRVIRLQNIRRDGFDDSDSAFIDETYYREELSGHDVLQGDLLIAGLGDDKNTVGRTCVAPVGIEPAMVKADCFRFRLDTKRALPEFIATQLTDGSAADAGLLSSGSTRSRIPLSVMSSRKIALPPLLEQKQIASFLRSEFTKFDTLTAEAQRAIALLQERRTALISAAVTGKIDVRGQL